MHPNAVPGYAPVCDAHLVLTLPMKQGLESHVKLLADQFHRLLLNKCCELACEFAVKNEQIVPESWTTIYKAGKIGG